MCRATGPIVKRMRGRCLTLRIARAIVRDSRPRRSPARYAGPYPAAAPDPVGASEPTRATRCAARLRRSVRRSVRESLASSLCGPWLARAAPLAAQSGNAPGHRHRQRRHDAARTPRCRSKAPASRGTTGAQRRVRDPRRARGHRTPSASASSASRRRPPASTIAGERRGAAGLHARPEHGPARADRRRRRLARAAHRGRGAGGPGGHLPGGAARAAGQHRDQRHPAGGVALDQLPAPERHRRGRHRAAFHPARPEPRPHAGPGERLAAAPDGAGQQLHLRHGRRLERRGPQRASRRARSTGSRCCATAPRPSTAPTPSRAWSTWCSRTARSRRSSTATSGATPPTTIPDDGTTVNVNGGWGIRSAAARSASSASSATGSRPTAPGPIRPRRPAPAWPTRSTTSARWSTRTTRCRSPTTTGATASRRTRSPSGNFRMPVNEAGSSEIYAFGGYSHRDGIGNPYRRYCRAAPGTGRRSIRSASCRRSRDW